MLNPVYLTESCLDVRHYFRIPTGGGLETIDLPPKTSCRKRQPRHSYTHPVSFNN